MLPQRGPVTATQKAQVTMCVTVGVTTVFAQASKQQDLADRTALNLATDKTPCWAGATPIFRAFAQPKGFGVAPAQRFAIRCPGRLAYLIHKNRSSRRNSSMRVIAASVLTSSAVRLRKP
jgi:hypothetical protein